MWLPPSTPAWMPCEDSVCDQDFYIDTVVQHNITEMLAETQKSMLDFLLE
eukprot:m.1032058 g.1032058  ORF g.1032058 m.1032058 type:complete len:50 (+) comp24123_c1_seq17:5780-5929(+)